MLPSAWNPPPPQPESSNRYWFNGIDNNPSVPADSGRMWMQQDHSLFTHPSHQVRFRQLHFNDPPKQRKDPLTDIDPCGFQSFSTGMFSFLTVV